MVGDGPASQQQQQQAGGNGAAGAAANASPPPASEQAQHQGIVRAPEDFQLPPGELSVVDRSRPLVASDMFRCAACLRPECSTAAGCAAMQWRNAPGGYLREVLTAKVYDVAIETPLDVAEKLRWVLVASGGCWWRASGGCWAAPRSAAANPAAPRAPQRGGGQHHPAEARGPAVCEELQAAGCVQQDGAADAGAGGCWRLPGRVLLLLLLRADAAAAAAAAWQMMLLLLLLLLRGRCCCCCCCCCCWRRPHLPEREAAPTRA